MFKPKLALIEIFAIVIKHIVSALSLRLYDIVSNMPLKSHCTFILLCIM